MPCNVVLICLVFLFVFIRSVRSGVLAVLPLQFYYPENVNEKKRNPAHDPMLVQSRWHWSCYKRKIRRKLKQLHMDLFSPVTCMVFFSAVGVVR